MMKRQLFLTGTLDRRTMKAWNCQKPPHRDILSEYDANTDGSRTEDGDKFLTRSTKFLDPAIPEDMPNLGFFRYMI